MIFPPYLGSPITDYSGEGGIIPTCFYLISFSNKPYRVIYTRYPYNYLKRLIRRFMRDKVKGFSSSYFRDVVNAPCDFIPKWFYAYSISIQPVYVEFCIHEMTKPLTKTRIREVTTLLTEFYTA